MATEIKIKADLFNPDYLRDTYGPNTTDKVEMSVAVASRSEEKFIVFEFDDIYSRSTVAIREEDLRRALKALADHEE